MNKSYSLLLAGVSALTLLGCASTEIYDDPENQKDDVRNEQSVSSAELRKAAQEAVNEALTDDDFIEFVAHYKSTKGKRPLMKVAKVKNDTDDPDLNTDEMTSFIENQLRKSKKVRLTRYEGSKRVSSIGNSRQNIDDPNFKLETVAQEGTIEAAVLIMYPQVISNNASDERKKRITRTFTIEIVDINGEVIMKCDKQLGFKKIKGMVGW